MEYVSYMTPDAAALKEQINKVRGDMTMSQFAERLKYNAPDIKVSASTISRACNWSGGNPVSVELLKAIALVADKESGVTFETLMKANGMRTKEEESKSSERQKFMERRRYIEKNCMMIIQNEIMCRGYTAQMLPGYFNGTTLNGYVHQRDRFFPRNYDFGFSVSGMHPCNVWKFSLFPVRLGSKRGVSDISLEAHVGNAINRFSGAFASDALESERYEKEKFSFVFCDEEIYELFLQRYETYEIKVNGLFTAILLDEENYKVLKETQLERYDGATAPSFFNEPVVEDEEDALEYIDPFHLKDDEE